ncbi:hypothetical protein C810_01337 [Lachnospiraceae bacterium A2]|nr:hypothetical protein C810_01337 [Lachnospiraceae bacterium A2]
MSIEYILECVKKTNPTMTRDKLIEELLKCQYSAIALYMVCESDKKSACK